MNCSREQFGVAPYRRPYIGCIRAVLAAFLLSLPGTGELRAQVRAVPVKAGLAPALALPALGAPSVSAPALLLTPAPLSASLLAAPALAPVALKPAVPAAAKATLVGAAKAVAALTPKSSGAASKETAGLAFEGAAARRAASAVSGGEGGGTPPLPPASKPPSVKALFLAGIQAAAPPGTVISYPEIGKIGFGLGLDAGKSGAVFAELLQDGHLALRANKDAVYFSFRGREDAARERSETEREADAAALEAIHRLNSGASADHAISVAKADKAVELYEKTFRTTGAPVPQLEEAKVLRSNAALELSMSMLKAHKTDLENREGLTPALEKRLADVDEVLIWLEVATDQNGRPAPRTERAHRKLVALLGSLNPAGENGAAASGDVADGYIAALDLFEKFDPRGFAYEGPSKTPPAAGAWKPSDEQASAFLAEIRARTAPGETVTADTLIRAGSALDLNASRMNAVVLALAARGQVQIRDGGAVVYYDLREQALEDEDGLWDLHNDAVEGVALSNAPDAASHLRAVARLDLVLARYFAEGRKSRAIEQVSIALANAKLEAITSALRPRDGDALVRNALALLAPAYYSAERRQDIGPLLAGMLRAAATLEVLLGGVFEKEAARGAKLTREFIENLGAGGGSRRAPASPTASKDRTFDSLDDFAAKLGAIGMPDAIRDIAKREYEKLSEMDPTDSEAQKIRTYLEWLVALPWSRRTEDTADIAAARALLDRDHAGLEAVKERVLEFLAVRKRTGSKKGAIIAFTGPPGTGKTSIASAIAQALGRKFVRLSLGGVHDESVLRGHGRTYVGSMPGEIMRQMKAAGTVNPVMLLDEADKLGRNGNKGDPTAALLEILDPEQNNTFRDRYLDVPYDLSEVLFVVTSNELGNIPAPLRDRMEIIEFDGYTTLEKLAIAEKHVVPQKRELVGLKPEEAALTKGALRAIIEGYTLEAGVRGLREKIETLLRKISAWTETRGEAAPAVVDAGDVAKYLGVERFSARQVAQNGVGVATGLAVDAYGGSTLNVEVSKEPGTGRLILRKQFGDDIEDSAMNALKYVKVNAAKFGLKDFDFTKHDIDINITPAGKVDGPSAGGLMVTAIISALTGRPVAPGLAMTGEITMRGDILPIGGLKQKVMAAHRMGYTEVIFPHANLKDLESIPREVRDGIKLTPARTYDDIYPSALAP